MQDFAPDQQQQNLHTKNTEVINNPQDSNAPTNYEAPKVYPPDMDRLASALAVLDPDCDENTRKYRRIAPLANEAKKHPELAEALYNLAVSWGRGDLQGTPAKAWITPGGNGMTGKQAFNGQWARFFNGSYSGKPATLGTIYYEARAAGWVPPDEQFVSTMKEPD